MKRQIIGPSNVITGQRVTEGKCLLAVSLRRNMTPAEAALWKELRNGKLGLHFRRQ